MGGPSVAAPRVGEQFFWKRCETDPDRHSDNFPDQFSALTLYIDTMSKLNYSKVSSLLKRN